MSNKQYEQRHSDILKQLGNLALDKIGWSQAEESSKKTLAPRLSEFYDIPLEDITKACRTSKTLDELATFIATHSLPRK